MVPVKIDGRELLVATTDPLDLSRLHALELAVGLTVKPVLAREKEIAARIEALYSSAYSADGNESAAQPIDGIGEEEDVAHLRDMASEVPVIRMVNQMLVRALESRASDVHIEPFENQLKVRYRIDGILHEVESPPRQLKAAVISRLKILAQLNIAERRLPQDGRIKTRVSRGKDSTCASSTVPTLYGESVVIRLLERGTDFHSSSRLWASRRICSASFNEMISKPHGMILVTGPTGSGKTTTLYGALQKINDPGKKIITIEDPVEYQLGRRQSDPCQAADRPDLRERAALDRAPGSRRHHGRRNPRRRDRRDRGAGRADRPLGVLDLAYQRCRRRDLSPAGNGCAGLSTFVVAAWACWRKGWCDASVRRAAKKFHLPA